MRWAVLHKTGVVQLRKLAWWLGEPQHVARSMSKEAVVDHLLGVWRVGSVQKLRVVVRTIQCTGQRPNAETLFNEVSMDAWIAEWTAEPEPY